MSGITVTNIIGLPLGRRIAAARQKARISQLELSIQTGITKDQISRIELGKSRPRLETIEKIEECLGLPKWTLLTGEVNSFVVLKDTDKERSRIYRQIIHELENCNLTIQQLCVVPCFCLFYILTTFLGKSQRTTLPVFFFYLIV